MKTEEKLGKLSVAFRLPEAECRFFTKHYKNLNNGTRRAVESWAYLRVVVLNELKGTLTQEQLKYLIHNFEGHRFEPQRAFRKELFILDMLHNETLCEKETNSDLNLTILLKKLNELRSFEILFLLDWIVCYWEVVHPAEQQTMDEYIKNLCGSPDATLINTIIEKTIEAVKD